MRRYNASVIISFMSNSMLLFVLLYVFLSFDSSVSMFIYFPVYQIPIPVDSKVIGGLWYKKQVTGTQNESINLSVKGQLR